MIKVILAFYYHWASVIAQLVKNLPAMQETRNSRSGRSSGEGTGNPLQYSCLGNSLDREAWRATVHGVAKSQTRLNDSHTHTHTHTHTHSYIAGRFFTN